MLGDTVAKLSLSPRILSGLWGSLSGSPMYCLMFIAVCFSFYSSAGLLLSLSHSKLLEVHRRCVGPAA
jgi:hypothetical protein